MVKMGSIQTLQETKTIRKTQVRKALVTENASKGNATKASIFIRLQVKRFLALIPRHKVKIKKK